MSDAPPFDPVRHRRGGRPRLDEEARRTERFVFWTTPDERTRIEAAASASLIRRPDFLRAAVLAAAGGNARSLRPASATLRIVAQLAWLGNNLNQLARAVNMGDLSPEIGERIAAAAEAIRAFLHRLADADDDPEC